MRAEIVKKEKIMRRLAGRNIIRKKKQRRRRSNKHKKQAILRLYNSSINQQGGAFPFAPLLLTAAAPLVGKIIGKILK